MAAVLNLLGALSGTAVAKTVGAGLVDAGSITQLTVAAALLSAIIWDLITWYLGIPTSSSHAILASLVGAAIATSGTAVIIKVGVYKVLFALIFSPVVGLLLGCGIMLLLMSIFKNWAPYAVNKTFNKLQIVSAAYMAFSHGNNDAQKTMGIITMALVSYYKLSDFHVPFWVILLCAFAMAMGTAAGGWRIIKTLGVRLVHLKPIHGFAAETAAATIIEAASRFGLPLSTTHVISSTIMGVGSAKRLSAVRWAVGGNIVMAWILTIPACVGLAWGITVVAHKMI
jgi:PiT family inorganic phosphate transporter